VVEEFEDAFPVNYGLPAKEKKKYAKAMQTFRLITYIMCSILKLEGG